MTAERRHRLIVDPPFQARQIMPVLTAAVAGAVAGASLSAAQASGPAMLSASLAAAALAGVVYAQVLRSHHIAGPVLRLRRLLQRLGEGDLSVHARLREGDELQELADAVSGASEALRAKLIEAQSAAAALRRLIRPNPHGNGSMAPRAELASAVQRLEAALGQFRTVPRVDDTPGRRPLLAPKRVEFLPTISARDDIARRLRRPLAEGI